MNDKKPANTDTKTENEEVKKLQTEIEEWKSKYLRALADYQNLEKRRVVERKEEFEFAAKEIICKFINVLDTLEKAQAVLKDEGLGLAIKQFENILKEENVTRIKTLGEKFDPMYMECIQVVEGQKDEIVCEETNSGYKMGDKIIRIAKVKVGKKSDNK